MRDTLFEFLVVPALLWMRLMAWLLQVDLTIETDEEE